MKKVLISTALASSLFLANCSSLGTLPTQVTTVVTQVQADAQAICQFVPTAQTIGAIVASLFPGGGAIDTIANGVATSICNALATAPKSAVKGRHGGALAYVKGVPIHGIYTR